MRSHILLLLFAGSAAFAAGVPFHQSAFRAATGGVPDGWETWAPRKDIAPRAFVDRNRSLGEAGSLAISGNGNPASYGGWHHDVKVQPGAWYRLTAHYRTEGPVYERAQVLALLEWRTADGRRTGTKEYAHNTVRVGDWRRITAEAPAPRNAAAVTIQLYLLNAPKATVWWDDISLESATAPAPRPVTIVSLNLRPQSSPSPAASVQQFAEAADRLCPAKTDLIVMSEGVTVIGTGKQPVDVAETIPGPTTERLGELAKRRSSYVVAGIYEREGIVVYNTAVLIDRGGKVAGKYRKVYVPREEVAGGLTPGAGYPVFDTDFGKIGIMICWDVQYADPARALALAGAEVVVLPIWGGNETLAKARAIENQVYLAASGYDYPTQIIDPNGKIIASAPERGTAAIATIDLNRRMADPWLGNMRGRFMKEVRLDIPVAPGTN